LCPPCALPIAQGEPGSPVVAAFAVADADRMNRRQIDDVEAHLGGVTQTACRARQGAVPRRRVDRGAREELVPGREARERALDDGFERRAIHGFERAVGSRRHELAQRFRQRAAAALFERLVAVEHGGIGEQGAALGAARACRGSAHQLCAFA
jgi:hypothetical protein